MRAHTSKNSGWFELTDNQYWFSYGFSEEIDFQSLYVTDDSGLVKSQNIMHCMPIWKKSLHDKYGYFDEEKYGTSADWAFWLECTKAEEIFLLYPESLSEYYINEKSHNRISDVDGLKENKIINDYLRIKQNRFEQQ